MTLDEARAGDATAAVADQAAPVSPAVDPRRYHEAADPQRSPVAALVGFALVGIGCANIVPVMFTLAGRQTAMPESLAIPAVTTLGYAGVLAAGLAGVIRHRPSATSPRRPSR